jgi:hypothetical protein
MPNSKKNILFNYEYRGAGNYKNFGSIVLCNSSQIEDLERNEEYIRELLFDTEFFYPYKLSIPLIHFETWIREVDHDWYRFLELEFTDESITDFRSFDEFLSDLKEFAKQP